MKLKKDSYSHQLKVLGLGALFVILFSTGCGSSHKEDTNNSVIPATLPSVTPSPSPAPSDKPKPNVTKRPTPMVIVKSTPKPNVTKTPTPTPMVIVKPTLKPISAPVSTPNPTPTVKPTPKPVVVVTPTPSATSAPSVDKKDIALRKIAAYAEHSTMAPTVQDYVDAGVHGVTTSTLDDINAAIKATERNHVDTTEKVQHLVDAVIASQVDTTAPVITLNGNANISIEKDSNYTELGATALDDVDGSVSVEINGTVDTSVVGNYTITYTAIDKAKNKATLKRYVAVVEGDNEAIKELNHILNDASIPYTTEADYNQSEYAKHHLSDRESERLSRAHKLVSIAKDPDPKWFKTKSDTPVIIAKAGESYTINLKKVNKAGNTYAPVDNDKLRLVVRVQRAKNVFEYITNVNIDQYAYWDGDGILKITVPKDLNKGRLLIGIRPNFDDVAVTAIAERWSTLISAEVWNMKDNIIVPENKNVLFPIDNDVLRGLSPESLFSLATISSSIQKSLKDEHTLLLPIVIKDMNISENDLISYAFKGKPYAGKVVELIKKGQQTLALMSPKYFDIYEIMDLEEGFAEHEGLLPEHVVYREGDAFNTDVNESDPVTFDKRRSRKKGSGGFFRENCSVGKSEFTYSPTFSLYPLDAGVSIAIHALSKETKCTWKVKLGKKPMINLDELLAKLGPAGAVLEGIFGAGGEMDPLGEVTVSVDQAPGFGIDGGFSLAKGGSFKVSSLAKTLGGIGSRDLTLFGSSAKAEISGSVGMTFKIKALSDDGAIGIIFKWLSLNFANIGLDAEASAKEALSTNILNAKEVFNSKKSSDVAFTIGASAKVSATPDLKNLFNALSIKATLEAKTPTVKLLEAKATAIHTFGSIEDDKKGKASVKGLTLKSRYLKKLLSDSKGVLAPSDDKSSVYNDPTEDISYNPDECDIEVPAIACSGWMCGSVEGKIKLCDEDDNKTIGVQISAVVGEARVGKEAKVSGTITGKGQVSVSIEGSPLKPAKTSLDLNNSSETIAFAKTCPSEPTVLRGKTIVTGTSKDGKEKVTKEARNLVVCHDDDNRGDPHIVTGDGLGYDYYASGDYILSRIKDVTGYEIQARFLPGYKTSWPQAVALQVGNDVVEIQGVKRDFHGDGTGRATNALIVWVNGKRVHGRRYHNAYSIGHDMIKLPSGGIIAITKTGYNIVLRFAYSITVIWPEESKFKNYGLILSVAEKNDPFVHIQIARPDDFAGQERGLMGNNDGDPKNDFIRRNGEVLGVDHNMSFTELYALFGTDWLVRPYESLFRNPEAIKPQFPTDVVTLTPEQRALGEQACEALAGFYREACIIDVGLTGNAELVKEYYANTEDLNNLSNKIITPDVDQPVYTMNIEDKVYTDNSGYYLHYKQNIHIVHEAGKGKFMLLVRPPRGATALLYGGDASLTAEGNYTTQIEVDCTELNSATNKAYLQSTGSVQLWLQDPLSGTASKMLSEAPLPCTDASKRAGYSLKRGLRTELADSNDTNLHYTQPLSIVHTNSYSGEYILEISPPTGAVVKLNGSSTELNITDSVEHNDILELDCSMADANATNGSVKLWEKDMLSGNKAYNYANYTLSCLKSKVLKTGQTTSYADFDDGDYQVGRARSYTRDDSKQIVTDNVTGLQWQDNSEAKTITKPWVTQANYDTDRYDDTSGDTATTYCANLSLGGYSNWRLPTRKELASIVDYGRYAPSLDPEFLNVASNHYWSSTTKSNIISRAWIVYFLYGNQNNSYGVNGSKNNKNYVRCVREGE